MYLDHYRPEEREFTADLAHKIQFVERSYRPELTHFFNPRQQVIAKQLLGNSETLKLVWDGGYEGAENQRLLICPYYEEVDRSALELTLIEVEYPKKVEKLSHRKLLGSLLSQGIQRDRLGDILQDGERWQFIVEKDLAPYLMTQVQRIGHASVHLQEVPFSQLLDRKEDGQSFQISVASLRQDLLLSEGFHLSRQKVKVAFDNREVKCNWVLASKPSHEVQVGDVLSLRHYGRLKLEAVLSETKKGKLRLQVTRYSNQ